MTDPHTGRFAGSSSSTEANASSSAAPPKSAGGSEAAVGPFTLREAVIGGSILLIFIGSLLPFFEARGSFGNLWNASSLFFLGIGIVLPVATAGLLTARRLGADTRIGSLSVDQFASVVAVLATAFFFLQTVTAFHIGPFICLLGGIGMLAATVGGPHLPIFAADFTGRPTASAHVMARGVMPAAPKPPKESKAAAPVPAEQVSHFSDQSGTTTHPRASAAAATAGASPTPGSTGNPSQPADQGKPAGGALRSRFGFGAAKASQAHDSQGPPNVHLKNEGGAVPGAQDKELSDADSSGYPRFADEDFAPYSTSPDAAPSPTSAPSADSVGTADKATTTGEHPADTTSAARDATTGADAPAAAPSGSTGADAPAAATSNTTAAAPSGTTGADAPAAATTVNQVVERRSDDAHEPISATKESDDAAVVEAFWFAVGTPRPVVDEVSGVELFVLRPGDWEVGIEDRGEEFLVQDKRTGRIGVMRDLSNIERAPSDG